MDPEHASDGDPGRRRDRTAVDRVVVLNHGSVVHEAATAMVLARPELLTELYLSHGEEP